jgi:hypothetical protein
MAAREGVLLTVERVLSPEEVRAHAHLGLLPGRYVRAVSPAPFGAHPSGLSPHGSSGAAGYSEDYDFIVSFQQAAESEARLQGCDTILAGIGAANLAAWLAQRALRTAGLAVDLVAEVGFVGCEPTPERTGVLILQQGHRSNRDSCGAFYRHRLNNHCKHIAVPRPAFHGQLIQVQVLQKVNPLAERNLMAGE